MEELPRCPISGKVSYPTKRVPKDQRIWRRGKKKSRGVGVLEVYKCTGCPYWHLTKGNNKRYPHAKFQERL